MGKPADFVGYAEGYSVRAWDFKPAMGGVAMENKLLGFHGLGSFLECCAGSECVGDISGAVERVDKINESAAGVGWINKLGIFFRPAPRVPIPAAG
jgi:hypothetical protein